MNNYVLDDKNEVNRLETQAKLANYSLENEFQYINFNAFSRVLDCGCGSGVLGKMILKKNPKIDYIGCDVSEIRLAGAKQISPELKFEQIDLFELNDFKKVPPIDLITNRFVLHHLSDPQAVIKNFYHALQDKGVCYIVDIDGLMINLGSTDKFLMNCLEQIKLNFYGKFENARFIPSQMKDAGFKDIQWRVQLMEFQNENRDAEIEQFHERFSMAEEFLIKSLGDPFTYKKFLKHFFMELNKPEVCLFYNKIISWGNK